MGTDRGELSAVVRELLELWDEQLFSVWLDVQLPTDWEWHAANGTVWPFPARRPS